MIIEEFFKKYDGKFLDYDKAFGAQCKDVFSAYNKEVVGNPNYIYGDAKDMLVNGEASGVYVKVDTPQLGDVVIWGTQMGQWGHIAIFKSGTKSSFVSFDQNYPLGSNCHFVNHTSRGVIGYLRAKNALGQEGELTMSQYDNLVVELDKTRRAIVDEMRVTFYQKGLEVTNLKNDINAEIKKINASIEDIKKAIASGNPCECLKEDDKEALGLVKKFTAWVKGIFGGK